MLWLSFWTFLFEMWPCISKRVCLSISLCLLVTLFIWQKTQKQVCKNNDAAFQCNFLFNIFFILWVLSVLIELYHRILIDFTWFCNSVCNFYNVITDVWMDGWTNRWTESWTETEWWADRLMNGWTCNIHAKKDDFPIDFAIFTKA